MRLSLRCLQDWVECGWNAADLGQRLTMAGLELESLESSVAPDFSGVCVGQVLRLAPHPNADQLQLTWVDVGDGHEQQIVCGASNVAAGLRVAVALPGARLPNDLHIAARPVRGQDSAGMLCSAQELGLEERSQGLLILDPDAPLGVDLRVYLQLDDQVLTLGVTPNRGDCLSVMGLAREVAALSGQTMQSLLSTATPPQHAQSLAIRIDAPQACPRYAGQRIDGIQAQARIPDWMRERLRRAGLRAIHPVVDVLNYVMLELGQPMHAFDCSKLKGTLQVRQARAGETLLLLDGNQANLAEDMLVIADDQGPQALAGIMGGLASAVDANTQSVFLESAFFTPKALAGRARRLGLHTDASHRFERGVDPQLPLRALQRAGALICEITGGQAAPLQCADAPAHLPPAISILLRRARLARVLGVAIADADIERILSALDMAPSPIEGGWQVQIPSHRFDLRIEVDLIEEVARVHGYAHLPARLPLAPLSAPADPALLATPQALRRLMQARDYQEVITYSFVSAAWQAQVDPQIVPIPLRNPISQDLAVMRTSLWPGLLQTLQYNLNRQQQRLRIFELGRVFRGERQDWMLGGVVAGANMPLSWANGRGNVDVFDVKQDIQALLREWRIDAEFIQAAAHPALHPGQAAEIRVGDQVIGRLGSLHPQLLSDLDLAVTPVLFEINLQQLQALGVTRPRYQGLSRFPALRRDLALLMPCEIAAGDVMAVICQAAPDVLRDVTLFDRYQGAGVPEHWQSLAFSLLLQSHEKTLDEQAISGIMDNIIHRLQDLGPVSIRQ